MAVGGHHRRIGTPVPILLLLLSLLESDSRNKRLNSIKPLPPLIRTGVNRLYQKKGETILFDVNVKLDAIFAVILSLNEYYKSEIITLFLFAGI